MLFNVQNHTSVNYIVPLTAQSCGGPEGVHLTGVDCTVCFDNLPSMEKLHDKTEIGFLPILNVI